MPIVSPVAPADVLNASYGDAVTGSSSTDTTPGYGIPAGTAFGGGTSVIQGFNGTGINAQNTTQSPPPKRSNGPSKKPG